MHNGYFLGVDVGSASVRAGVYSASGHRLAFATAPVSQFRPGGERVEQSSAEIWQQVCNGERGDSFGRHPHFRNSLTGF